MNIYLQDYSRTSIQIITEGIFSVFCGIVWLVSAGTRISQSKLIQQSQKKISPLCKPCLIGDEARIRKVWTIQSNRFCLKRKRKIKHSTDCYCISVCIQQNCALTQELCPRTQYPLQATSQFNHSLWPLTITCKKFRGCKSNLLTLFPPHCGFETVIKRTNGIKARFKRCAIWYTNSRRKCV